MGEIRYTPDGYIDMERVLTQDPLPFIWMIGGRGTGKTYGVIDYLLRRKQKPFILMRRTKKQADYTGDPNLTPLEANLREGETLEKEQSGADGLSILKLMVDGKELNRIYVVGLSVVSSLRGINLRHCDYLMYDEFIKEPHDRPIKEEWEAFRRAYETINRNRELQGDPPLRVVALSNATTVNNPYFVGMNIVNEVYLMSGDSWHNAKRGISVYHPSSRDLLERKKQTALYRMSESTSNVDNDWPDLDTTNVKTLNLSTAKPVCVIDKVGFYRVHGGILYASAMLPSGVPMYDLSVSVDKRNVHKYNQGVISRLYDRKVLFESVDILLKCAEITERT